MKFLEEICFYLTRSWIDIFVIVKTNVFVIDGYRQVLVCFTFRACSVCFLQRPPTFVLERLLSLVQTALIAKSVFFKTLSKSIYTSNMIKGGGHGGLERKNH